ncbi:MAG: hypothetical protein HZA18_04095 [Nitrospirae bacterium]|nr:hypothetical protein [Nitrospirota bacterium]
MDPAFNSMIKTYVRFLENCEEMHNGGTSLNEDFKNRVLNNPGWHNVYVEDRPLY